MAIHLVLLKYMNLGGKRRRIMDADLLTFCHPSDKFLTTQIFRHLPGAKNQLGDELNVLKRELVRALIVTETMCVPSFS
jgi:hypothetical protein